LSNISDSVFSCLGRNYLDNKAIYISIINRFFVAFFIHTILVFIRPQEPSEKPSGDEIDAGTNRDGKAIRKIY
jgi:hypothetical protein